MNKVKILHCGDIHLDTPFKEFNKEVAKNNKEEIKRVLKNIINICNEEKIDILLIAGDVFDNYTVKKETLVYVSKIFKMLENTRVFISPGNHDPFNEKSFYTLIDWPENVYIFKGDMERIDLDDLNLSVHGFAFNEKYIKETKLKDINIKENNINILVCHGDLNGKSSDYNPILKEDIEMSKLDYIALGHIHLYYGIQKIGQTTYAYSGCPQGRGFDELDSKGVIIGEVSKGFTDLSFRETSIRNYYSIKVDVTNLNTTLEVEEKIKDATKDYKRDKDLFKIILIGNTSKEFNINENIILESLKEEFYFIKIINNTKIQINYDHINLDSVEGIFINEIKKRMEDEEDTEILELALDIGLRSLMNEEVNLDDY